MAIKKTISVVFLMMTLIVIINLIAYFIAGESSNYIQDFIAAKHQSSQVFTHLNQLSLLLMGAVLIFNMQMFMQDMQPQKYLLLLLCAINLFLPLTVDYYALLSAINNAITLLTNAWLQLFCPATIRGMVSGLLTAIYGVLDIFDTYIENEGLFVKQALHISAVVMFGVVIWMSWQLKKLSPQLIAQIKPQKNSAIDELLKRYLFVFLSCILVGLNCGIFYYTYNDALMILPDMHPQIFQYMVNIVSVLAPFIFGFIADRYGYMQIQMKLFYLITLVHFLNSLVEILGYHSIYTLYGLSFIDCALANCIWVTIIAICGEYFLSQGLFRSFALYGILYSLGNFFCDLIYAKFSASFANYQFFVGLVNVLFLIVIFINFKQFQKNENVI